MGIVEQFGFDGGGVSLAIGFVFLLVVAIEWGLTGWGLGRGASEKEAAIGASNANAVQKVFE